MLFAANEQFHLIYEDHLPQNEGRNACRVSTNLGLTNRPLGKANVWVSTKKERAPKAHHMMR